MKKLLAGMFALSMATSAMAANLATYQVVPPSITKTANSGGAGHSLMWGAITPSTTYAGFIILPLTVTLDGSGNTVLLTNAIMAQGPAGSVTALQGGTWTVQPGNTANTTAWLWTYTTTATSTPVPVTPASGAQTPFSTSNTGVGSITNTCYIASWTTSVTGSNGFIDCRGAASISFCIEDKVKTDHAAYGGKSSSVSEDSGFGGYLPTTSTDSAWNDVMNSTVSWLASGTYVITSPPPFLRLRWSGPNVAGEGQTISVKYIISFKNGGSNIFEAGPTPPLHGPTP